MDTNILNHDTFVREVLSNKKIARDFFNIYLPEDIKHLVNLNHLDLQQRSFIDDVGKESIVDILYKTTIEEKESYLYLLIEHQSSPDKLMPFRIFKYTCNIIDHHLKNSKQKTIPLVYPFVIYHGESPYPYSNNIKDMVDAPKELVDRYFLKPFQLIDLGQITDEELKKHTWVGIMEFVMKHISARDILQHLKNIQTQIKIVVENGGKKNVTITLQYACQKGDVPDKEEFYKFSNQISEKIGENIMTLAEQCRREGIEEGEIKNKFETARRLFSEGMNVDFIAKITELSLEKLYKIREEVIS